MRRSMRAPSIFLAMAATACVVYSTSVEEMTPEEGAGTTIDAPLKAFLASGEIVVYLERATVTPSEVVGRGVRYTLDLSDSTEVDRLPLDSVVGLEAFDGSINPIGTLMGTVGATALVVLGAVGIACAADPKCFGSCPTIYTWEDDEEVLEAEAFSYSIAPLLEGRDVDRLGVRPDDDGLVRLELRNEALETHYINHLELLQVDHEEGRTASVDETGRLVTVGNLVPVRSAHDRDGRSLLSELGRRDGDATRSSPSRLRAVTPEDPTDHVVLSFPAPRSDSVGLSLRLRNSLLTSVLFYDMMLGSQGAEALNWLGRDIQRIGPAVQLGRWFNETMGLRVDVRGPEGWVEVARVPDSGPIAWKDLVVRIPAPVGPSLDVRLRSLADQWRIDHVALAEDLRTADPTVLPLHSITPVGGAPDEELRRRLAEPDDDYLTTSAATALTLEFRPESTALQRTFFLSSQGYYTEWIRPEWIRSASTPEPFRPTARTAVELVERWIAVKDDFEERFFATRIPVR